MSKIHFSLGAMAPRVESKQQLIERAKIYDQQERASDHGIGRPGGPTGLMKPRAPAATGNAALLRRLRKLCPELHAQVMAGELTVVGAAKMAGLIKSGPKPRIPIPTANGDSITSTQEMELWLGPSPRLGSLFSDDEARRRAWMEHRDRLMTLFACNGRRPVAWWKYESLIPWPGFNRERSTLWAANLLGAAEARELEQGWRQAFDRSLEPGFSFQGETGWEAHLRFLIWHDVPPELAEQWATPSAA